MLDRCPIIIADWSIRCQHAQVMPGTSNPAPVTSSSSSSPAPSAMSVRLFLTCLTIVTDPHLSHYRDWSSPVSPSWLILTCLTIVTVFTLCWMPIESALFLTSVADVSRPYNLLRWLTICSCFNSCVNPIIYGLMWRPFRAALRDVSTALPIKVGYNK